MTKFGYKVFRLQASDIKPLATGFGECFATDMITVHARKVGFMYREEPMHADDSGWCFLAGFEDDEYMGNTDNLSAFDVNTIANYDPDIIPFLDAPTGSAFEREDGTGSFVAVDDFEPGD